MVGALDEIDAIASIALLASTTTYNVAGVLDDGHDFGTHQQIVLNQQDPQVTA